MTNITADKLKARIEENIKKCDDLILIQTMASNKVAEIYRTKPVEENNVKIAKRDKRINELALAKLEEGNKCCGNCSRGIKSGEIGTYFVDMRIQNKHKGYILCREYDGTNGSEYGSWVANEHYCKFHEQKI